MTLTNPLQTVITQWGNWDIEYKGCKLVVGVIIHP